MMRKFLALVLCSALPLPALAQTHVIAELGTAPLIGQVASTQQLRTDVRSKRAIFAAAGEGLGLTPAEFVQFQERIERSDVTYVRIPRHLDAMSWRSAGRVHVLHDVVIPANTMGWEVDLAEGDHVLALFVPNKCGNLSLLRRPLPALAEARPPVVKGVSVTAPPPVQTAPVVAVAPPVQATPAPYAALATSNAPVTAARHMRAWPLLLLVPIVAMLASHGGSGPVSVSPLSPPPPPGAAPAPPAGCPTPTPSH